MVGYFLLASQELSPIDREVTQFNPNVYECAVLKMGYLQMPLLINNVRDIEDVVQ